jgi:hypothetical protein
VGKDSSEGDRGLPGGKNIFKISLEDMDLASEYY